MWWNPNIVFLIIQESSINILHFLFFFFTYHCLPLISKSEKFEILFQIFSLFFESDKEDERACAHGLILKWRRDGGRGMKRIPSRLHAKHRSQHQAQSHQQ